jgi:hypothetical protein
MLWHFTGRARLSAAAQRRQSAPILQLESLERRFVLSGGIENGPGRLIADALSVGIDRPAHWRGPTHVKAAASVDAPRGNQAKDMPGVATGQSLAKPEAGPPDVAPGHDSVPTKQSNSGGNGKNSEQSGSDAGQPGHGGSAGAGPKTLPPDHSNSAAARDGGPTGNAKDSGPSGSDASQTAHGNSQDAQQDAGPKTSPPGQSHAVAAPNDDSGHNAQDSQQSNPNTGRGQQITVGEKEQDFGPPDTSDVDGPSNSSGKSPTHSGSESGQDGVVNAAGPDGNGNVDDGSTQGQGRGEGLGLSQPLTAIRASDTEPIAALTDAPDSTPQGDWGAEDAIGVPLLMRVRRLLTASVLQRVDSESGNQPPPEIGRELARRESAPASESGPANDAAPDQVMEALADPLQTLPVTADVYLFAEDWHDFLAGARAAGDDMMHLASRSGPSCWLTGTAIALVAVELTRLQRERALRTGVATWPEIVAPRGLA